MSTATIELSSTRQKLFESLGDSQAAYIDHMKQWFRKKSTKEEFDLAARKLLSKDVIYLHNQFLLAILNKCQTLVNINPGPSLVKSELGTLTITQELLSPSKFDPSADRLKKGKIKRKVKPNKPQLDHKFQPVATSLCAPEVTPVNLPKEEKEVSLTYISIKDLKGEIYLNFSVTITVTILFPREDSAGYFPHSRPAAGLRLGGGTRGGGGRRGVPDPGRGRGPAPEAGLQPGHEPQQLAGNYRDEAQRRGWASRPLAPQHADKVTSG